MPYQVPQIIHFVSRVAHFSLSYTLDPGKLMLWIYASIRLNRNSAEALPSIPLYPHPTLPRFSRKRGECMTLKSIVPSVILCFVLSSRVLQSPRLRLETSQLRKHCKDGTPRKDESGRVSWTIQSHRRRAASATHTSVDRCHCQG
jgi:hypothetical protein